LFERSGVESPIAHYHGKLAVPWYLRTVAFEKIGQKW
jgi:hypothetical protein